MEYKDITIHLRRTDREMNNISEIEEIIASQKYMTIAMCKGNEPYLVTLSFGHDKENHCFYFHSATDGKKLDILKENPRVWGQILQDRGYVEGKCSHAYTCVEFGGIASFIENAEEKQRALSLMIDQLDPNPIPVKERLVAKKDLTRVVVGRIKVEFISGKKAY